MTFPESPRQARLLGLTLLVTTFVMGGLAGAAADRLLAAREPAAEARTEERRDSRDGRRTSTLDKLDLTAEQRERIDAVLEAGRTKTEAFWDQHGPTLRAIVDSTRAEIRSLLTPEQRAEYDRLRAERRRRSRDQDRDQDRDQNDSQKGREK